MGDAPVSLGPLEAEDAAMLVDVTADISDVAVEEPKDARHLVIAADFEDVAEEEEEEECVTDLEYNLFPSLVVPAQFSFRPRCTDCVAVLVRAALPGARTRILGARARG
jgi:hypothetical protein